MGLVSSSLDSTLRMLDLERGVLAASVGVHRKGVRTFAHSPAFSLVARWGHWRGEGLRDGQGVGQAGRAL